jgi:hypothetical protein
VRTPDVETGDGPVKLDVSFGGRFPDAEELDKDPVAVGNEPVPRG